jgi:hypothetical protein
MIGSGVLVGWMSTMGINLADLWFIHSSFCTKQTSNAHLNQQTKEQEETDISIFCHVLFISFVILRVGEFAAYLLVHLISSRFLDQNFNSNFRPGNNNNFSRGRNGNRFRLRFRLLLSLLCKGCVHQIERPKALMALLRYSFSVVSVVSFRNDVASRLGSST